MVGTQQLYRFVPRHAMEFGSDDAWQTVDGTLCLVDISGFTHLSERLARKGRVGAEELTEVLNRVFGSMLDLARDRGGELLKYGGDALLLLFEGDDHAGQAASAAVEMRTSLREAVGIPTSVGRVALRMSTGVHTGEVHLFSAKGSHRELIVAGPAASMVTRMESTATAGEIVVSTDTRDLLPHGSAATAKGAGWLLRWRKPRSEPCGPVDVVDSDSGRVRENIPTALRPYLSVDRLDSEHRLAAVAFVEFTGVDDLLARDGPSAVCAALGELIATVTAIVDEESVTFLATDVDENAGKIILVSGVPATQIDECGRILRVVRQIADIDTPFGLKVGVNRGHVFAGEIGTDHRSTFTVMGDVVNLAARLMAAAPVGEIYAVPQVLEESLTVFESSSLEPISVRGKDEPVQATAVGDEIGPRSHDRSGVLPFVGRASEVADLEAYLDGVTRGIGGAVTVTGPAGIGKTRLIDEVLDRGRTEVHIAEIRAEPYGAASPYRPLRDEVRRILSIERGTNEEMAAALVAALERIAPEFVPYAPLLGDVAHIDVPDTRETESIDAQFRRTRVADILVDLLTAWADRPVVIVAEDIHWADPASTELLDRLVREAVDRSWVVISTSRDHMEGDIATHLALEPLDVETTTELIYAATEAAPLPPGDVGAIVERSGGNPLFVQELLEIIRETGDVSTLPMSLDGVVGSQIDALDPVSRTALRYLSVLGRSFRTSIARTFLATQGIDLTDSVRRTLNGFLSDDGPDRLRFRHALVRDVAYEGLPFRRRRDLHLRAGALILDRSDDEEAILDVLSLHFSLGGDRELSWRYSLRAGDRNMEAFANLEAEMEFERAIDAARLLGTVDPAERKGVWLKLGDVRERSGKFSDSLAAYRRAASFASDDPVAKADVLLRCARAKERSGSYSQALSEVTRARHLVEGLTDPGANIVVAHALGFEALIRQAQEKPALAIEAAERAVSAARVADDDIVLARAWKVMDYANVMLGRLDLAVNSVKALEIFENVGDLQEVAGVSTNLGAFAYWNGDWSTALEYYEQGREASTRVGNMVDAAVAAANIGEVLVNQGRFEEAAEPLRAARRAYLASGFGEGVGFVDLLMGRMYGINDQLAEAEDALTRSIDELQVLGLSGSVLEAKIHLADARCRSGSPERGLATLAEAKAEAPSEHLAYYDLLFSRVRGSILAAAGRTAEATATLESALANSADSTDDYERSLIVLTLDRVAAGTVDDADLDEARRALRALGVRTVPGVSL